jgi:hypothetical protein
MSATMPAKQGMLLRIARTRPGPTGRGAPPDRTCDAVPANPEPAATLLLCITTDIRRI